jgi:hypothetical protein
MTAPRTGGAARLLYRDRHLAVGSWYTLTTPDGTVYELCSGACLVSFAVHGALPANVEPKRGADGEGEVAA